MADEALLIILRQKVVVWNKWWVENPDVSIDLRETILSRADLIGADISRADFRGADLSMTISIDWDYLSNSAPAMP